MPQSAAKKMTSTPIDETAELGYGAILVAEGEEGGYEPVSIVSTIREAREIAGQDLRIRMSELERGGERLCPSRYVIWLPNFRVAYRITTTIDAD